MQSRPEFAIITERGRIQRWQADWLEGCIASGSVPVAVLDLAPKAQKRGVAQLLWHLYKRFFIQSGGQALEPVRLESLRTVRTVTVGVSTNDFSLDDHALDFLERAGCSRLLNLTSRKLSMPRTGVPTQGIWEFEALVAPEWSVSGPEVAQVQLRLVHSTATGKVVKRAGTVNCVPKSFAQTVDRAYNSMRPWLDCTFNGSQTEAPLEGDALDRVSEPLTSTAQLGVLPRFAANRLKWFATRLALQEEWHVGIVNQPIEEVFRAGTVEDVTWIANPPRQYLADPFGVPNSSTLLVERFDMISSRGDIAATDLQNPELTFRQELSTNGHLSYPFLFQSEGSLYCLPEMIDQRRLALFNWETSQSQWVAWADIEIDVKAVDPTMIHHDNRWWLFCTDALAGENSHLFVFHADDLAGPWVPHVLNPVKVDVNSSRSGGTPFRVGNRLIRPAQQHRRGYGSGIVFNEILTLTDHEFVEQSVATLSPPNGPYRHGLHTVSEWGNRTLVDGKQTRFSVSSLIGTAVGLVRRGWQSRASTRDR